MLDRLRGTDGTLFIPTWAVLLCVAAGVVVVGLVVVPAALSIAAGVAIEQRTPKTTSVSDYASWVGQWQAVRPEFVAHFPATPGVGAEFYAEAGFLQGSDTIALLEHRSAAEVNAALAGASANAVTPAMIWSQPISVVLGHFGIAWDSYAPTSTSTFVILHEDDRGIAFVWGDPTTGEVVYGAISD